MGIIKNFKKRTISRDLILGLTLAIGFVTTSLGTVYYAYSTLSLQRELNARATYITDELAMVLTRPLWHLDYDTIQQITRAYLSAEDLAGIRVKSDSGDIVFDNLPQNTTAFITRNKKVFKEDEYVGQIELLFINKSIQQVQRTMVRIIGVIIFSVIGVVILGTYLIMKFLLSKPLNQLTTGVRTIASGDYQNPLAPVPQSDINMIINEVNMMAGQIATRTQQLKNEILERTKVEEALKNSLEETVKSLGRMTEQRDPYTAGHQQRVDRIACAIARELGLPEERIEGLHVAALLHDIGKISLPAEFLAKPSKLTRQEKEIIKCHTEVGCGILKSVPFPWPISEIILQHHELLDGSGYPHGLHSKEILLEAKILTVADVVEAMSSHRPYRPSLGLTMALEEIKSGRGSRYDALVVDACVRLIADKKLDLFDKKVPDLHE